MKIRIPLLRVKSDYHLMGKVGQELVRGNGQLNGNFSECALCVKFIGCGKKVLVLDRYFLLVRNIFSYDGNFVAKSKFYDRKFIVTKRMTIMLKIKKELKELSRGG